MWTITKILHPVNCKYGAPMGRPDVGTRPTKGKIYTKHVKMYDGGYDKGGAYWGMGMGSDPLFVDFTKDMTYIHFYRRPYYK